MCLGVATFADDIPMAEQQLGLDNLPYTILGYTNGPGYHYHRTKNGSLATATNIRRNITEDVASGAMGR